MVYAKFITKEQLNTATKAVPVVSTEPEPEYRRQAASQMESYLNMQPTVPRRHAKFEIRYQDERTIMTGHGEYLYFSDQKKTIEVRDYLNFAFKVGCHACYGPAATVRRMGKRI